MGNFLLILVAFLLVLLNAFFVAAEFGMVKLRATRVEAIKALYGFRGRILADIHQNLDAYLSACQLGITLASLGLGWVGEPAFASLFAPILQWAGVSSPRLVSVIAFVSAFSLISILHIVVGELMPKSMAIRQSERVSVWTAVPLYGFYWMMYPLIWVLNACSNFLLKRFGLAQVHQGENFYSTEEIKLLLTGSHLYGELTRDEVEIIEHTLDLAELRVTEVMRLRTEMTSINLQMSVSETLALISKYRYSRYPVFDAKTQDVVGLIHVKDVLAALYQQGELVDLKPLIRPVLKISRRLPALDLLRKFREGMSHFALVYSGQGSLIGFVTLDNLLHVLLGRIKDEFHRTQVDWHVNEDGSLSVRGECSIYSLEQAIGKEIALEEEEVETLAGLIFNRLGTMPKEGERIVFDGFEAIVEEVLASRILKIRILVIEPEVDE